MTELSLRNLYVPIHNVPTALPRLTADRYVRINSLALFYPCCRHQQVLMDGAYWR